jgi:hypothetical protein
MKKMISLAAIVTIVSVFAIAGCQKETSAPKPAEQTSGTTTVTPAKAPQGC